ncbi:hypothetical protein MATL_G00260510 [Megalops atlanticus]|uniref:Uncharacterized protein n=1 Tax=Megalops atlanticus TaxID=7932 RepID=A0A9D3SVR6_MEGAT|nr:hypothetical protein MATL_G00260510 [Megalops atlanticus]
MVESCGHQQKQETARGNQNTATERTLLAAFTLIFHNKLAYPTPARFRIMEQSTEATWTVSQYDVSGEPGEPILSEVELSVAQRIGRQLAEIGDQLNCRCCRCLPDPWLLPLHMASCTRSLRRVAGLRRRGNAKPRETTAWLTSVLHSQVVRRLERWGIWVSHIGHPHSWAAGILTVALLVTAAIWVGF